MPDKKWCDACAEYVVPEMTIVDSGVSIPGSMIPAIKQCPECGNVLNYPTKE